MDFGAEFCDDFFEKPREKKGVATASYEARVFVPLWYMETELSGKASDDVLVALKHQADYYYYSENYGKAAETYERCLELVPLCNNTWKREFMENLARSLLHLDKAEKSLEWSLKLYESSVNADQKVISMNLLAAVCHRLGKYKEELEALHCCLEAHKASPEFWLRLGLCYAGLFKIDLPGYTVLKPVIDSDAEPCCAFNSKTTTCQCTKPQENDKPSSVPVSTAESAIPSSSTCLMPTDKSSNTENKIDTTKCEVCTLGIHIVSTCFIHTRMLLESNGPNLLGAERDEGIKEKISDGLKHMEVDQTFIDIASKMLGSDFLTGLQEVRDISLNPSNSFSEKLNSGVHKSDD